MAKEKYKGNCSNNARIKINYDGKKPKVIFSYPSKKDQVRGPMFRNVFIFYFLIFFVIFGVITIALQDFKHTRNEELYYECLNQDNYSEIKYCYTIYLDPETNGKLMDDINVLIGMFLLTFLFTIFTYFPFRKFWSNVYPVYKSFLASKKIKRFSSKDIKHSKELGYYCELPVFENVVLNFEAKRDFSKYLCLFEIEEHKFKYYKPTKKKKRVINEFLWYARFYFKEKPVNGYLEVLFR